MPTLTLTDAQTLELIRQLSPEQQGKVLEYLILRQWGTWADLSRQGQAAARLLAVQRGRDWDSMTEEAREAFVDDLVHEDR